MSEAKEEPTFAAYKGLGYVSMFYGVPLGPVLVLSAIGVFGGFLICWLFGAWGLLCPASCALVLLVLKEICSADNKAMERAKWSFKSWRLRLRLTSRIITVSPNKVGSKHERFRRQLKKIYRSR